MSNKGFKKQVELLVGCEVPEDIYTEALILANEKQERLLKREGAQEYEKEEWYLAKLTQEYIQYVCFRDLTIELGRNYKKKESAALEATHPAHNLMLSDSASDVNSKEAF